MNTQPEALRLADWLESEDMPTESASCADAAAELRRLHEENQMLLKALAEAHEFKMRYWLNVKHNSERTNEL